MSSDARRSAQKAAILAALRVGNTRRAAAAAGDVTHTTLYAWMADDLTFSAEVEKAEADAEATYLAAIKTAVPKSWQAAAWWLERRKPADYARREHIDLNIRGVAERLAAEFGLDADEVMAEAERIVKAAAQ